MISQSVKHHFYDEIAAVSQLLWYKRKKSLF